MPLGLSDLKNREEFLFGGKSPKDGLIYHIYLLKILSFSLVVKGRGEDALLKHFPLENSIVIFFLMGESCS